MLQFKRFFSRRSVLAGGMGSAATVAALGGSALARSAPVAPADGSAVETLLSKQAIAEVLHRYPRGLDRLDRDILLSLGHANATVQFGERKFDTWSAFVDWLMSAHLDMIANNHRMTNMLIEVRGDTAVSETTGTATLLAKSKDPNFVEERWMHSRYLDRWSRRDGKWALDHRQTMTDYRRVSLVPAADLKTRYTIGERLGRDDPSYKLFGA